MSAPGRQSACPLWVLSVVAVLSPWFATGVRAEPAPDLGADLDAAPAAHELGQSYVFLRVYEDSLVLRVEVTTADLERRLSFGWDPTASRSVEQVEARLDSIRAYVEAGFAVATNRGPASARFRSMDVRFLEVAEFVMLEYLVDGIEGIPDSVSVTFPILMEIDPTHRNFLVLEHNWKTGTFNAEIIAGVFTPDAPTQTLDLSRSTALRGFLAMIRQGMWHIWIGLDHILFLIALVLPAVLVRDSGRWVPVANFRSAAWRIVGIVTFFTLAHSVTLSLAALELVRIPPRLVESVIAGSIAVAAWANLLPSLRVREAAIAFVFGLFHGFGFAHVLSDIGLGREHLVLSLFGFNLGVEIGQIAIVAAVFPVIFLIRRRRAYLWILRYGSVALIGLALIWLFERVFEVNVPIVGLVRSVLGMG